MEIIPNTSIIINTDSLPLWNPPFNSLQQQENAVKEGVKLYPIPVNGTFRK